MWGLSAAERTLNINLPTISAHLASLEDSIGFKLCDRGRKGFRLTKEGQSVLEACNKLFESLEQFQSELSAVTQMISGSLKIGIVDNIITDKNCSLIPVINALKSQSKTHSELMTRARRPRFIAITSESRWQESIKEHFLLMAAIELRDSRIAGEILYKHVLKTGETYLDFLSGSEQSSPQPFSGHSL